MIRSAEDRQLTARITRVSEISGVRAGSALLSIDDLLLVVGDDAHAVTWLDPVTGATRGQPLAGDGEPLEKSRKPDYEAAFHDGDDVWLLGSGSLSNRWLATRLARPGDARATTHDLTALFAALATEIGGAPNIEGAVLDGDRLRLVHRATGSSPDILIEVSAGVLHGATARVRAVTPWEPAVLGGVPAHVTDLALLADGRLAWLAAAEDTDDPVLDGPVAGTAFGVVEGDLARWTPILSAEGDASILKAEGLVVEAGLASGWAVTDRDDPDLPAQLLRLALTGL